MEVAEIINIGRDSLFVLMKISLPLMMVAMIVGLAISLFQALTQIQEMTLTFVPKMVAIFIALLFLMPFIASEMTAYNERLAEKMMQLD